MQQIQEKPEKASIRWGKLNDDMAQWTDEEISQCWASTQGVIRALFGFPAAKAEQFTDPWDHMGPMSRIRRHQDIPRPDRF